MISRVTRRGATKRPPDAQRDAMERILEAKQRAANDLQAITIKLQLFSIQICHLCINACLILDCLYEQKKRSANLTAFEAKNRNSNTIPVNSRERQQQEANQREFARFSCQVVLFWSQCNSFHQLSLRILPVVHDTSCTH